MKKKKKTLLKTPHLHTKNKRKTLWMKSIILTRYGNQHLNWRGVFQKGASQGPPKGCN
jgi:hypothetical protein